MPVKTLSLITQIGTILAFTLIRLLLLQKFEEFSDMTEQINSFTCKSLLFLVVCLVFSSSALAIGENNYLLVTQNLSKKLQSDLADSNLTVKLNSVEEYEISGSEIELKGSATCVLAKQNNQLPLEFEIKVNPANQNVLDVKYNFAEAPADIYAPTSNEEILMKELMTKIRHDYKTENIVIAIDTVEKVEGTNDANKFSGVGEVRIGDMVWNKIKFDVVLDAQTRKANRVVYRVEK